MKIDVIERYKTFKSQLEELRDDIKCAQKIINDPKIDWYKKQEYQINICEDRRNIMTINEQLNILMDYMYQNKMNAEIEEINELKEEEKNTLIYRTK